MKIYTFQPREVFNEALRSGIVHAEFEKSNLKHKLDNGADFFHAYFWMGTKLSMKCGVWDKGSDGKEYAVLPFWGWYLTDGKNEKPGDDYRFDYPGCAWLNWNENGRCALAELSIPDEYVLLSDANAWYCVLEGRPCYEYESHEKELELEKRFRTKLSEAFAMEPSSKKTCILDSLLREMYDSWENIFRLEGRRLRPFFPFGTEKKDVQAVFPFIRGEWIREIWD